MDTHNHPHTQTRNENLSKLHVTQGHIAHSQAHSLRYKHNTHFIHSHSPVEQKYIRNGNLSDTQLYRLILSYEHIITDTTIHIGGHPEMNDLDHSNQERHFDKN